MTAEAAAAKVPVPVEKLTEWEEGISQPTIRQAQTLAKAYKRPFALFFLPDVPRDFLPLQDFRKPGAKPLTTSSVFIIREIQQKQSWISEVLAENGEQKLPFVGRYSLTNAPQKVAADIVATLKVQPGRYASGKPMREWVQAAEAGGIFVSRAGFIHTRQKLDADELQGFAIADAYAPFVFINADDWEAPQLFTLVHELAHIWIAETGISAEVEPSIKHKDKHHPVERFCNEVAAHALMPTTLVKVVSNEAFKTYEGIFQTARGLGVSSFALLVRASTLR